MDLRRLQNRYNPKKCQFFFFFHNHRENLGTENKKKKIEKINLEENVNLFH